MPDNFKILFDTVGKEYDLGTAEQFARRMGTPENRLQFFQSVGKEYDLGTFGEFETRIGKRQAKVKAEAKAEAEQEKPGFLKRTGLSLLENIATNYGMGNPTQANPLLQANLTKYLTGGYERPESKGFGEGAAEFIGGAAADLPMMIGAGGLGGGVVKKLGLGGMKGLLAREAVAGSAFGATRPAENIKERALHSLEDAAVWMGFGVVGKGVSKGFKALKLKIRSGVELSNAEKAAIVAMEKTNAEIGDLTQEEISQRATEIRGLLPAHPITLPESMENISNKKLLETAKRLNIPELHRTGVPKSSGYLADEVNEALIKAGKLHGESKITVSGGEYGKASRQGLGGLQRVGEEIEPGVSEKVAGVEAAQADRMVEKVGQELQVKTIGGEQYVAPREDISRELRKKKYIRPKELSLRERVRLVGIKPSRDYRTKELQQDIGMDLIRKDGVAADDLAKTLWMEGYDVKSGDELIELLKAERRIRGQKSEVRSQKFAAEGLEASFKKDQTIAENRFGDIAKKEVPESKAAGDLEVGEVVSRKGDVYRVEEQTGAGARLKDHIEEVVEPWEEQEVIGRVRKGKAEGRSQKSEVRSQKSEARYQMPGAKQPWEMTLAEFFETHKESRSPVFRDPDSHKAFVKDALNRGRAVPPEVLAEYPDLAKGVEKEIATRIEKTAAGEQITPKKVEPKVLSKDTIRFKRLSAKSSRLYEAEEGQYYRLSENKKTYDLIDETTGKILKQIQAKQIADHYYKEGFEEFVKPEATLKNRIEKTAAGEQITPMELRPQAEVPRGKIGKESLPIEGRGGVGMFGAKEKPVKQEELFAKRIKEKPIIYDGKTIKEWQQEETRLAGKLAEAKNKTMIYSIEKRLSTAREVIDNIRPVELKSTKDWQNALQSSINDVIIPYGKETKASYVAHEKRQAFQRFLTKIGFGRAKPYESQEELFKRARKLEGMKEYENEIYNQIEAGYQKGVSIKAKTEAIPYTGGKADYAMRKAAEKKGESIALHGIKPGIGMGEQTKTPEFKKWFGDWEKEPEKASKVVDKQGKPLVVYHGTKANIIEFKKPKKEKSFTPSGLQMDFGIHFTESQELASQYATHIKGKKIKNGSIYPVFIKLEKPIDVRKIRYEILNREKFEKNNLIENSIELSSDEKSLIDKLRFTEALRGRIDVGRMPSSSWIGTDPYVRYYNLENLIEHNPAYKAEKDILESGFDGVIYNATFRSQKGNKFNIEGESYVVFSPTQIKSAIGNQGTFSAADPNILHGISPVGAVAGVERDEEGNWTYDPVKGAAGMVTTAALGSMGVKAIRQLVKDYRHPRFGIVAEGFEDVGGTGLGKTRNLAPKMIKVYKSAATATSLQKKEASRGLTKAILNEMDDYGTDDFNTLLKAKGYNAEKLTEKQGLDVLNEMVEGRKYNPEEAAAAAKIRNTFTKEDHRSPDGTLIDELPEKSMTRVAMENIYKKTIRSGSAVLRKQGKSGEAMAGMITEAQNHFEVNAGVATEKLKNSWIAAIKAMRKDNKDITDLAAKENLRNILEGRGTAVLPEVKTATDLTRQYFKKVELRALALGKDFTILKKDGKRKPWTARINYFPQYWDMRRLKTVLRTRREEIIRKIAETDKIPMIDAEDKIRKFLIGVNERRGAGLQHERPDWIPEFARMKDPMAELVLYINNAERRLTEAKRFGIKDEKIKELISGIYDEGGDAGFAKALFDRYAGKDIQESLWQDLSRVVNNFQVLTKLTFASIANASQPVNTLMFTNFKSFAKGFQRALTQEGRDFALKTGAALESTIRQIMEEAGGAYGNWAQKSLKYTGFTATEKFNRILSANMGKVFVEDIVAKGMKRGSFKDIEIRALKKLALNPEKILANKGLSERELLTAGKLVSDITQFRHGAMELPLWWTSAGGRIVTQFKKYAYNQTRFLWENMVKEAGKGNLKPLLIFLTAFPVLGEMVGDVRALIGAKKRPSFKEQPIQRLIENISWVGGMGIALDYLRALRYRGGSFSFLGGPTFGTVAGFGDAMGKLIYGPPMLKEPLGAKKEAKRQLEYRLKAPVQLLEGQVPLFRAAKRQLFGSKDNTGVFGTPKEKTGKRRKRRPGRRESRPSR